MSSVSSIAPARLQQIKDFLAANNFADAELRPLAGDASFRRYIRIRRDGKTFMLMDAPPEKEDVRPYMKIALYLHGQGCSVPAIVANDPAAGLLLLEDLGDDSFTAVLKRGFRKKAAEQKLYAAAIDLLVQWHRNAQLQPLSPLALPTYTQDLLVQEASLFSDWYLPQVVGKETAATMREEYRSLWRGILSSVPLATNHWVHRDYHADNLMWLPKRKGTARVGLLDFQDGVYGDAAYDLVSLLEDARRDIPEALARDMLARYIAASGVDREQFAAAYAVLGAQRNSKIVGIFVRLAARDNKHQYLNYLPRVWGHLERDLTHPALAPLKTWIDKRVPANMRGAVAVRHTSGDLALSA